MNCFAKHSKKWRQNLKKKLYNLIDDHQYIKNNCYQHQISRALERQFDVVYIPIESIQRVNIDDKTLILSRLKLRTLNRLLPQIKECIKDRSIVVYDQDPWESYMIGSQCLGSYDKIHSQLNVKTFLNTSAWWSELITAQLLPSMFVPMWLLPEYCPEPIPWSQRKHDVVFCGLLHQHRKTFLEGLKQEDIDVEILQTRSYKDYLNILSESRIFVHSQRVMWPITFQTLEFPNAMWIRDVEIAARGCFSLRETDEDMKSYNMDLIKSFITHDGVQDAAKKIKHILSRTPKQNDKVIKDSVEFVRGTDKWSVIVDIMDRLTDEHLNAHNVG